MVELEKIEMTEQDLAEKKLHLESCKLQKDETDLMVEEMESVVDQKLSTRMLQDDIDKLNEDIKEKVRYDTDGKKVPATEADLARMKITLAKFEKQKELDLPARQMRFKLNQLREAKKRIDAPEQQIHKLEKEIREKAFYQTARPVQPSTMCG